MKNSIIISALMACMTLFGTTKEEYASRFETALSNENFEVCANCLVNTYEYEENGRKRQKTEKTYDMGERMWLKWIDSSKKVDDTTFKVMVRDLNASRFDLVQKTMKKDITPGQMETLLFDVNMQDLARSQNQEHLELIHSHLQDKSVSTNMFPLCQKYKFAMEYWPDEFYLVNYDKKFFTYENDRMQIFFYHMLSSSMYQYSPLFLKMAEKYIGVCSNNVDNIVRMIQKLDGVYGTNEYTMKYYSKFDGNFNVQFALAYEMDSQDKMVDLLVKNTDNMTFDQIEKTTYVLNSVDDEYRKTDIDNILKNLKTKYGNKETESTAWEKLIEKIDAMIELRAD